MDNYQPELPLDIQIIWICTCIYIGFNSLWAFFSSNLNENLSVVIDMEKVSDTSEIPSFETGNFKFFSFFLLYFTYFL